MNSSTNVAFWMDSKWIWNFEWYLPLERQTKVAISVTYWLSFVNLGSFYDTILIRVVAISSYHRITLFLNTVLSVNIAPQLALNQLSDNSFTRWCLVELLIKCFWIFFPMLKIYTFRPQQRVSWGQSDASTFPHLQPSVMWGRYRKDEFSRSPDFIAYIERTIFLSNISHLHGSVL